MGRKSHEPSEARVRATRKGVEETMAEVDWDAIDAMTDEEIARQIAENPDAAPDTSDWDGAYWVVPAGGFDVRALRLRLGLTQEVFARRLGVPLGTLRNWEQGRSTPTGAALALIKLIARLGPPAIAALERAG